MKNFIIKYILYVIIYIRYQILVTDEQFHTRTPQRTLPKNPIWFGIFRHSNGVFIRSFRIVCELGGFFLLFGCKLFTNVDKFWHCTHSTVVFYSNNYLHIQHILTSDVEFLLSLVLIFDWFLMKSTFCFFPLRQMDLANLTPLAWTKHAPVLFMFMFYLLCVKMIVHFVSWYQIFFVAQFHLIRPSPLALGIFLNSMFPSYKMVFLPDRYVFATLASPFFYKTRFRSHGMVVLGGPK